jgi:hypothetical protein
MFAPHVAVKKMKGYLAGASQCDATVGRRERDCMSSAAVAHSQLSNTTSCNSESGVARSCSILATALSESNITLGQVDPGGERQARLSVIAPFHTFR